MRFQIKADHSLWRYPENVLYEDKKSFEALGLLVVLASWSADMKMGGVVPIGIVRLLGGRKRGMVLLDILVSLGLASIDEDAVDISSSLISFVDSSRGWLKHRTHVFDRDGHACVYCDSPDDLTLDHVTPRSRGGSDSRDNLVAACRSCNSFKRARTPEEAGMQMRSR